MLVRIVQLTFQEDRIPDFLNHFETVKTQINEFPGCLGMKLLIDHNEPTRVMTYSEWENQESLNAYRDSKTFGEIWPTIKQWFAAPPQAWSTSVHFNGFDKKK